MSIDVVLHEPEQPGNTGAIGRTCLCAGAGLGLRHAGDEAGNLHVFLGGELWQQVMRLEHKADAFVAESRQRTGVQRKDVGAVDDQTPLLRGKERAQDLEQGGLSCAGGAHDGHYLCF